MSQHSSQDHNHTNNNNQQPPKPQDRQHSQDQPQETHEPAPQAVSPTKKQRSPKRQSIKEHQNRSQEIEMSRVPHTDKARQSKEDIPIQEIMREADPQQQPPASSAASRRQSVIEPTLTKNATEKCDWKLHQLQPSKLIEQLQSAERRQSADRGQSAEKRQSIQVPSGELPFKNDIVIRVVGTVFFKMGMNQHIGYTVQTHDSSGTTKFTRRYTQYMQFRSVLTKLWPGIFIPILPNKTLMGSSQEEIIRSRSKYINHFWRKTAAYQQVYYSQEVQLFITAQENVNIEATLDKIQIPSRPEMLEKYKNVFGQAYSTSQQSEFMYRKQTLPVELQKYVNYFGHKKNSLTQAKQSFYKMAQAKTKYFKAINKLNNIVLPQYEDVLLRWFSGTPIRDNEPGIMQRMTMKIRQSRESASIKPQATNQTELATKKTEEISSKTEQVSKKPEESVKQQSNNIYSHIPSQVQWKSLFNSEAYKSRLEETAYSIHDYNSSTWALYDAIKFQLKDISTVTEVISQVTSYQKDIEYLKRNIANNKETLEALNNKQTTLKTFFMGGSEDLKREKLSTQSQNFEDQFQKLTELYQIVLVLIQQQLNQYHQERVDHYTQALKKAATDQLGVAKAIMDFHVYEYQLFAKERVRKIGELYGGQGRQSSQQEEQGSKEQAKGSFEKQQQVSQS